MERRTVLMLTLAGYLQSSVAILTRFADAATAEPVEPLVSSVPDKPIWDLVSQPVLTIPAEITIPPGTKDTFIPVSVDRTDRQSFIAYIDRLINVRFGGVNVGNVNDQRTRLQTH